VNKLADGAATGISANLNNSNAISLLGILIPILPVPAERIGVVSR